MEAWPPRSPVAKLGRVGRVVWTGPGWPGKVGRGLVWAWGNPGQVGNGGTRHQTSPVSTVCLPRQASFWTSSSTSGSRTEEPDCCSQVRPTALPGPAPPSWGVILRWGSALWTDPTVATHKGPPFSSLCFSSGKRNQAATPLPERPWEAECRPRARVPAGGSRGLRGPRAPGFIRRLERSSLGQ